MATTDAKTQAAESSARLVMRNIKALGTEEPYWCIEWTDPVTGKPRLDILKAARVGKTPTTDANGVDFT